MLISTGGQAKGKNRQKYEISPLPVPANVMINGKITTVIPKALQFQGSTPRAT